MPKTQTHVALMIPEKIYSDRGVGAEGGHGVLDEFRGLHLTETFSDTAGDALLFQPGVDADSISLLPLLQGET